MLCFCKLLKDFDLFFNLLVGLNIAWHNIVVFLAFYLKRSKFAKPWMGERAVNGWLLVGVGWVWCGLGNPQLLLPFIFFQAGIFCLIGCLVLVDFNPLCRIPRSLSLLLASVKFTVVQSLKGHSLGSTKCGRRMEKTTCFRGESSPQYLDWRITR